MSEIVLSRGIIGSWSLILREDRSATGEIIEEPSLGSDPYGLLIYDPGGNFAAQFMKRDRSGEAEQVLKIRGSAPNNTRATGGYDAYFGKYAVDDQSRTVTQTLIGALAPENVGQVITREMLVDGDTLTIHLATTAADGQRVDRKLVWRRVG